MQSDGVLSLLTVTERYCLKRENKKTLQTQFVAYFSTFGFMCVITTLSDAVKYSEKSIECLLNAAQTEHPHIFTISFDH